MSSASLSYRPVRHLLVINDSRIKRNRFKGVARLLNRMDHLEERVFRFHNQDRVEFGEWTRKTFTRERERLNGIKDRLEDLLSLHEAVMLTASMLGVPLPAAYRLVMEERRAYAEGSMVLRAHVEEHQRARQKFARQEREEREKLDTSDGSVASDGAGESTGTLHPFQVQSRISREQWRRDLLERLQRLSDEALARACASQETALQLLRLCDEAAAPELFFRVWSFLSDEVQSAYECPPAQTPDHERLRVVYRKLVRRLHPDAREAHEPWRERMWNRIQSAYDRGDLKELERWHHLTLLRAKAFSELTVNDIQRSAAWLKKELILLEQEVQRLRGLPAWDFSRRRRRGQSLGGIRKRVRKELNAEWRQLRPQVNELEQFHKALARASRGRSLGPLFMGIPL
ncbi:MAG: hypothetical protein AB7P49_00540 [Bdellovibrionales bacterium]